MPLFESHVPPVLMELSGGMKGVVQRIPRPYIKNAIANCLASRIVYSEGTRFIDMLPDETLASSALRYHEAKKGVDELTAAVEAMDGVDEATRASIQALLKAGGARTAIQHAVTL